MVSGWNECDCGCTGSVQHRLKTELFSVTMRHIYIYIYLILSLSLSLYIYIYMYIYTMIRVWERETRERR